MKEYKIMITEELAKIIYIEAESKEEALSKVEHDYIGGDIVLDVDDFSGTWTANIIDD